MPLVISCGWPNRMVILILRVDVFNLNERLFELHGQIFFFKKELFEMHWQLTRLRKISEKIC